MANAIRMTVVVREEPWWLFKLFCREQTYYLLSPIDCPWEVAEGFRREILKDKKVVSAKLERVDLSPPLGDNG